MLASEIRIRTRFDFEKIPAGNDFHVRLMVSVHGEDTAGLLNRRPRLSIYPRDEDEAGDEGRQLISDSRGLILRGLKVKFEPKIKQITARQLNTYPRLAAAWYSMGDVKDRQEKRIIFELTIPAIAREGIFDIGTVTAKAERSTIMGFHKIEDSIQVSLQVVAENDFQSVEPDESVLVESAYLQIGVAISESIQLADQEEYGRAASVLSDMASNLESLGIGDADLGQRIKELRKRAELIQTERKRSPKFPSHKSMFMEWIYRCYSIEGYIFLEKGEERYFIDTGSPKSFGNGNEINFAGSTHPIVEKFIGYSIDKISLLTGIKSTCAIGYDILRKYNFSIELTKEQAKFYTVGTVDLGDKIDMAIILGIPVIKVEINQMKTPLFVDTGANLSYLESRMLSSFEVIGTDIDFIPGYGRVRTETMQVSAKIGAKDYQLNFGILPSAVENEILKLGVKGILGTEIIQRNKISFDNINNQMIINR